ncbi:hypothetical protein CMV_015388 [Castanea mollissima]|uniref:Uncharacterized protein n=1 Tax=Castanea mollissima TaxID=60419 RepID=A0A8J4QV10_9ROSI|nr:hypothetical protein CMV_015388 [Castanea mollissima]
MAVAIYKQLKRLSLSPNDYTYATVIEALCRKDDMEEAVHRSYLGEQVLQAWKGASASNDAYAYAAVICGFCNENGALIHRGKWKKPRHESGFEPIISPSTNSYGMGK